MAESFRGYSPVERDEKSRETIEQKRERFGRIIDRLTNPKTAIKARDVLRGKLSEITSYGQPKDMIFFAETVMRQRQRGSVDMHKLVGGIGHMPPINREGTGFDNEPTSDTLRPVRTEDRALLTELLALSDDEQVKLGMPPLRTEIDERTTENRFREVLTTAGELLQYLADAQERGTK